MTYYYYKTTKTWNGQPQYIQKTKTEDETIDLWKHLAEKKNWRIVQLPNGYYQAEYNKEDAWIDVTRRESLDACETAIDKSIEHYKKKLEFADGPKVIKTFK